MKTTQSELGLFRIKEVDPNVPFLMATMQGRDWTTAKAIMGLVLEQTQVKWRDRKVRALAAASKGHILGGHKGYKLNGAMTADEYQHWRNWMMSQADKMKARVLEADLVFYGRKPVVL